MANFLRLLKLPDDVQKLVEKGDLTFGHAKALMTLATSSLMTEVARKVVTNSLSVRQTEALVTNLVQARPAAKKERIVDPNVREAEEMLHRALGVRVHDSRPPRQRAHRAGVRVAGGLRPHRRGDCEAVKL